MDDTGIEPTTSSVSGKDTAQVIAHNSANILAAAAGDPAACRQALREAARTLPPGPGDPGLPYLSLDDAHLARWRGNCLVTAGDPQAAEDLDAALAAMDRTFTRARAGLHCDLAAVRHASGEHDEARRHLASARQLADATGSARFRRRVRDLTARMALPGPA